MSPATGILRFKQLKQKAYADIWETIMDRMEEAERNGVKSLSISKFPPYTMMMMSDDLLEAGYDVTVEIGEYSDRVSLHLVWP